MNTGKKARIFLHPGELFIAHEPTVITTVLGSCVSVTMYSPRFKIGGMCHALLPKSGKVTASDSFRFVDHAILHMIGEFARLGVERKDIQVKLFGGSDVIAAGDKVATVGTQNVQKALEILKRERLTLRAHDVRGEEGRKIYFNTCTGEILLKRVRKPDMRGVR